MGHSAVVLFLYVSLIGIGAPVPTTAEDKLQGKQCTLTPSCVNPLFECSVDEGDDFEVTCWCPAENARQTQAQAWTIDEKARPSDYGELKNWRYPSSGGTRSTLKVKNASKRHSSKVCCLLNVTETSRPDQVCVDITVKEQMIPRSFNSTATLLKSISSARSTNGSTKYNVLVRCTFRASQSNELCNGLHAVDVDGLMYPFDDSSESKCDELEKTTEYLLQNVSRGANITCQFTSFTGSRPVTYISEPVVVPGKDTSENKDAEEAEGSEGNETVYIAVPVAVVVSLLVVVVVVLIVRKWRKRANGPEVFELPRRLRPTNDEPSVSSDDDGSSSGVQLIFDPPVESTPNALLSEGASRPEVEVDERIPQQHSCLPAGHGLTARPSEGDPSESSPEVIVRESIPVKQQQEQEEPIPKEHSSSNERAARDPTVLSGEPHSVSLSSPVVTSAQIEVIKDIVVEDWVKFGRMLLKFNVSEVRDILSPYQNEQLGNSEKAYYVLEFWKKKEGIRATVDKLLEACEKINKRGAAEEALKLVNGFC